MIAVDTNILVYAHRPDLPLHAAAARCVEELATGASHWGLPWPCSTSCGRPAAACSCRRVTRTWPRWDR